LVPSTEVARARFAGFEIDFPSAELTKNGQRLRLQGQPFLVLRILLERAGEVVTREELQRQLWSEETFVDFDHGLNKTIAKLREALDDPKSESKLIETIPRRGYRFTAAVEWIGPHDGLPVLQQEPVPDRPLLNRYWLFGSLVLVLVVATILWLSRVGERKRFNAAPGIQSIAVLPLVNLSNDPEQEYFADGMTDQLITELSYAKSLRIVSRESTIGYKRSFLLLPQIAEQLQVDAVMEGTVLRAGDTIRITIRLIAVKPERQLWTTSFERNLGDAVTLQRQIAAEAVSQVRAQLTPEERTRLNAESRINPEAYDEYLRGRFFLQQESAQVTKSIPHLERAIQLDPSFAAAYAALGEAWGLDGVWSGKGNRQTSALALEYSKKSVSLDPGSSEAYASLGHSLMQSRRWNEGEVALRHALELDPNNSMAAEYLAILLASKGRTGESVRISHELAIANPVAIYFQRMYANFLFRARRYDDAIAQCQRILELDAIHPATYTTLGSALVEKGRFQEAEAAFRRTEGALRNPGAQAWLEARKGKLEAARQILKANPSISSAKTALARYILGDQAAGLAELDHLANDLWFTGSYNLLNDPSYDPMRSDPRFTAIVKKTGLLDN
jgi:TolB-like protein/DNA-binding winged helix-turn-helix (wHTH) protein/Tfp pilus assembly protein PilF